MRSTCRVVAIVLSLMLAMILAGCGKSTDSWTEIDPDGTRPNARWAQGTVYLESSQALLVFGGMDAQWRAFNDTWLYDPSTNTWTELEPTGDLPPARGFHALAADDRSGNVYLLGGYFDDASLGDLWLYDVAANQWTQLHPTGDLPGPREWHSLVYVPSTSTLIVFGGWDRQQDLALDDTWAYDPATNTWTELHPGGDIPPARSGHSMVYDGSTDSLILFGGAGEGANNFLNDIWSYDPAANAWTELYPEGDPRTWDWDETASTWYNPYPGGKYPEERGFQAMVADTSTGELLLFGGMNGRVGFNDLWAYDPVADTWTELFPDGRVPEPRCSLSMGYDPTTGKVLIFGGLLGTVALNDLWSYTSQPIADREPIDRR